MNVPKAALSGAATIGGLIGLGVLVVAKVAIDCATRAGLR